MANRQNMIRAARLPPRAKCLVRRAVSSKEESAGLKWTRQERERERDAIKEGEGLEQDLLQVAPDREAGGSHLQATEEEERIVEWTRELREIRRLVELLQRRDRKLHVKADVAVRRLERLEKELPAGGRRARSQPGTMNSRTTPTRTPYTNSSLPQVCWSGFCLEVWFLLRRDASHKKKNLHLTRTALL